MRLLIGLLGLVATALMASDSDSEAYVLELKDCGFDHGYICREVAESDFIGKDADDRMVSGNYLKAFNVAYSTFLASDDFTLAQKNLRHYKIGFSENDDAYVVHFQGLLLPQVEGGEVAGLSRAIVGQSVRYWIDKETLQVADRVLYK